METSMIQSTGYKFGRSIEQQLLKTGKVLEVRIWTDSPMVEIDLHLPGADISQWHEVPYIKFRVGKLSFRDYTPFGWDAETCTCSLLIDTGHNGPGSRWARNLCAGNMIQYLKIERTHQAPNLTNLIVGLGDNSSMAHLLALQQLTMPGIRYTGAILTDGPQTGQLFETFFRSPLTVHTNEADMTAWLAGQYFCTEHTSFYLAGNNGLVTGLRKVLKGLGHSNVKIKGFWP